MPLVRISLLKDKSPAYKAAIGEGVYRSLREAFGVPEDDRFILFHEHEGIDFDCSRTYLGIARSDDLVVIQITANNTRGIEQKKALYAAIADRLAADPGLGRGDVFINLIDVAKENWSFGDGLAQYA